MEYVELGKISKVVAGQAAPKVFDKVGFPFIRAGHLESLLQGLSLDDLPKISKEVAINKRLKILPKGSVIFAKSGMSATKNRIYITEQDSYFVSHLAGILESDLITNKYLHRFLSWFNPSNLILDSAYPSIRLQDINTLKIPLPPLATQKKIAAILDEADKVRQLNKQLIKKYDALTQSLFLEMFGDPVTNPKGWEKTKIEDFALVSSGSTPSRKNDSYYNGSIPWVKTGEVNGRVIISTEENITQIALDNSSCKLYPKNSIIIAMYGQGKTRGQVGVLGVEATTNQACAVIQIFEKLNYIFLFRLLHLSYENLRSLGRGGNQPNLNSGLIKKYEVIIPQIQLQNQFAERVQIIENQKQQAQESLQKSEDLFNSLLQKAFKGALVS